MVYDEGKRSKLKENRAKTEIERGKNGRKNNYSQLVKDLRRYEKLNLNAKGLLAEESANAIEMLIAERDKAIEDLADSITIHMAVFTVSIINKMVQYVHAIMILSVMKKILNLSGEDWGNSYEYNKKIDM